MPRHLLLIPFFLAATAPVALAQTPVPVGEDFQVNTYTSGSQRYPSVAVDPSGAFVVVWGSGSAANDSSSTSVHGQRFASNGGTLGEQFQINTYTTDSQWAPVVGVDAAGAFVVAWYSYGGTSGSDTMATSIQAQRYASDGDALGSEFQVNTYTTLDQQYPVIAVGSAGEFVVVWESLGSPGDDSSSWSIQGQRFASDGQRLGAQFQVNTYTTGVQQIAALAMDEEGAFVVVWNRFGPSTITAHGQRFDSSGGRLGAEFQVSSYTAQNQVYPSVAVAPGGDFLVVWSSSSSPGDDSDDFSIQGRLFAGTGDPAGQDFQVNDLTTNFQAFPSAAVDGDGNFVVTWTGGASLGGDMSYTSIQGRRLDSNGGHLGAEFQVNSYPPGYQLFQRVAVDPLGDFVTAWQSDESAADDADGFSIQGRRFRVTADVGDRVWFDTDGNGAQDGGEPGAPGIVVSLFDAGGVLLQQVVTDGDGHYIFRVEPGEYYLEFGLPAGYAFTLQDAASDDFDSDADDLGFTAIFTLSQAGTTDASLDAGLVSATVQVGDRVWLDANQDGVQTGGEVGVSGVEVRLYREPATLEGTAVTDEDGYYVVSADPGTFYLEFACSLESFTAQDQEGDDDVDSDVDPSTGTTSLFELAPTETDGSRDAGLLDPDSDGVACSDNCPDDANPDQTDTDGDGSGDPCDLCAGDDAGGDADSDGLCAGSPYECDDSDPTNACAPIFDDGFESGDTSLWSSTVP